MTLSAAAHLALLWLKPVALTADTYLATSAPTVTVSLGAPDDAAPETAEATPLAETPASPAREPAATAPQADDARARMAHAAPAGVALHDRFEASARSVRVGKAATDGLPRSQILAGSAAGISLASSSSASGIRVPMPNAERVMIAERLADWGETLQVGPAVESAEHWEHDGRHYRATLRRLPAANDTTLDRIAVEISTEVDGQPLSAAMELKRLAFSNYAQFVNRWDRDVQIHDDELDGRFHSNTTINLTYSRKVGPRFHGKVTTASRRINFVEPAGRRRRDEIFAGGVETGVRRIALPKNSVPVPSAAMLAAGRVQRFDSDSRIRFFADGSYRWASLKNNLFERRGSLGATTHYLIAEDGVRLEVEGIVNGRVLVYSPDTISIAGDLLYATDPAVADGDDYIGIVAERTVEVAKRKVTGPGDLTVHGAIYARRLFRVREYQRRGGDTLTIVGSLTAGSLTATEPRFATLIRFDPRLAERRPPGFPLTDRYEPADWDGAWTAAGVASATGR